MTTITRVKRSVFKASLWAALPLCVLLAASCSKPEEAPAPPPGQAAGGGPGGGGPPGPGGGRRGGPGGGPGGAPVAADASGADIFKAKCRCHGPEGKGGGAPALTALGGKPDADLAKIIHDGKGKMPAFGSQLTTEQINKVVAHIKQLGTKS